MRNKQQLTLAKGPTEKQCELCAGTGTEKRMLSLFVCRRCGGRGTVKA